MSLNSRGNLSWNDDFATGWSRSNFYAIFSVNRYAYCVWLLHKYEAHMKGIPICFSEVQVRNDVTDNKKTLCDCIWRGMQKYHRAARAFKALLSHHIISLHIHSFLHPRENINGKIGTGFMSELMNTPVKNITKQVNALAYFQDETEDWWQLLTFRPQE